MIQELILGGSSSITTTSAYSGGGIISAEATMAAASESPFDAANNISNNSSNAEQNLRCPRCDSSNTKFCYYNNYNLTQPRHFCKTCRRYWTKGGALRNVPIGGGCRKNKTSFTGKPRVFSTSADMLLKSGFLDPQESSLHHPIMWSSPPQPQTSSHLLDFLRSTQSPIPSNHTSYPISSAPLQSSNQAPTMFNAMNVLNNQTSLSGLEYHFNSFLRNRNQTTTQPQHLQVHLQQNKVAQQQVGGLQQNSGIQKLYQRMNLSANSNTNSFSCGVNDTTNHVHAVLANGHGVSVSSSPTSSRPTLESSQVTTGGGESDSRLWNNTPAGDYSTWTNDHLPAATNGDGCHF